MGRLAIMQEAQEKRSKQDRIAEIRKKADLPTLEPKGTPKEHNKNTKGTPKEQDKGIPKEHNDSVTVTLLEHDRNTIYDAEKRNSIGTPSISLSKQHFKVYNWLISRGYKGTFNKALATKETGVAYMTVRKALWRLESTGIIKSKYDATLKEYEYTIDQNIDVKGPKRNTIGTGTEQYQNTTGTPALIEEEDIYINSLLQLIRTRFSSLSKIGLHRNDITSVVKTWKLLGADLSTLPLMLEMMNHSVESGNWPSRDGTVDKPLAYIRKCLQDGSFDRPKGFVSQQERMAGMMAEEQQRIADQRKVAADLEFENMLADPDSDLYRQCLERFNKYEKRDPADPKFQPTMRKYFDKDKAKNACS